MIKFIYKHYDHIPDELKALTIFSSIPKEEIEDGAMDQAINLSLLPFAFHHIALMPDVHQGYGMPIGGVLASKKVVIPNAVGKDIGCGVTAVKTGLLVNELDPDKLKNIMGVIRQLIPMGFGKWHSEMRDNDFMPSRFNTKIKPPVPFHGFLFDTNSIVGQQYDKARKQLGTLGAGNHFIEIQKDREDNIWIMIHSGGRNLGSRVANHYDNIAKKLNEKWHTMVPKKWDLAFLPIETREAKQYMIEMNYCVEFAKANRSMMMAKIQHAFIGEFAKDYNFNQIFPNDIVDIAHNYAKWENHYGQNVIVHRKGATYAGEGHIGIIPGSQRTKSYIVKGLGNKESLNSCSHGAGRCMSRTAAKKNLNLEDEIKKMNDLGIVHGMRNKNDLDEAGGAYKDIENVMDAQKDLVEIIAELSPIAVLKG